MNEIEFIDKANKIRTLLKKKEFSDEIKILLNRKIEKKRVTIPPFLQKMYLLTKDIVIKKYRFEDIKYIILFFAFHTQNSNEIINDYTILQRAINDYILYTNYKKNVSEYFIIDFFNTYKISDMKTFINDKIYNYGLLRDLMDNKISVMLYLILDEMFGFSIYMNKQDIVFWKKYKNKISNMKKFFNISIKLDSFISIYEKLKKKLEIEYKTDLGKIIKKNANFIKEI